LTKGKVGYVKPSAGFQIIFEVGGSSEKRKGLKQNIANGIEWALAISLSGLADDRLSGRRQGH